jgi:thioredoxin 2
MLKPRPAGSIFPIRISEKPMPDANAAAHPNPAATAAADTVVVACPHCAQKNRLLRARRSGATCGSCKQSLWPDRPIATSDASWQTDVEQAPIPVLVDFWAPWCGPCRAVAPMLDAIAKERAGQLKVVKLNVDDNPRTAARFGIQAIPTMMIFRGTQVLDQIRGALPKPALDKHLDQLRL